MTEKQKCQCQQICTHYGIEGQKGILTEECAELIQAVSKLTRAEQSGKLYKCRNPRYCNMSYEQWKEWKKKIKKDGDVNGRNIS